MSLNWTGHRDLVFTAAGRHNLVLRRPAAGWTEAMLLGNGDLGAAVWGPPHRLVVSVNKSDVWDYRHPQRPVMPDVPWTELAKIVRRGDREALGQVRWNDGRTYAYPALQICGDLVIEMARGELWSDFSQVLSLEHAETTITYRPVYCAKGGPRTQSPVSVEAIAAATHSVIALRLPAMGTIVGRDVLPQFMLRLSRQHNSILPTPIYWCEEDGLFLELTMPDGLRYVMACQVADGRLRDTEAYRYEAAAVLHARSDGPSDLFITVATSREGSDPRALCRERLAGAASLGFEQVQSEHRAWWRNYSESCSVELADKEVERSWYLGMYLQGSACRPDTQPIGLQGIWNQDNVPAWNSDYHNDTNTQLCYWSIYPTGHLDLGLPLYRMLAGEWLEPSRQAAAYFGRRGVKAPIAAGPDGNNLAGHWGCWQGATAWLALHILWHWRYSQDRAGIAEFYPYLKECALFYEDSLVEGADGLLHIGPDLSPEQMDAVLGSWGEDGAATLSLAECLLKEMITLAEELGVDADKREQWRGLVRRIAPYPQQDGHFIDLRGRKYAFTHRHTSRLFAIHPTGEIGLDSDSEQLELARRSYREFVSYGTERFGGFSCVELAAIAARLGLADAAWDHLRAANANFPFANGLNIADGSESSSGFFQIEANLGLPYSVCEALLQSHEDALRLFPAVPKNWTGRFHSLLAMGAFRVSATMTGGACNAVTITSLAGKPLRVVNPFPGPAVVEIHEPERQTAINLTGAVLSLATQPGGAYRFGPM